MEEPTNNKVEAYLLGQLKGKELKAFKAQLKTDKALAKEVTLQRTLMEQVESMGAMQMKNQLLEIKDKLQNRRRRVIRRMLGLSAAAAIALLVFSTQYFGSTSGPQDLYQNYYQTYNLPFGARDEGQKTVHEAGTFYLASEYQKAIPLLEQLLVDNPKDSRSRLALGISYLGLDQEQTAIDALAPLIEEGDALYLDQARWYTALAFLKQNKIEESRKQLILLSGNPRGVHYKETKQLLSELANQ